MAISISFAERVGDLVTLEVTNGANTFQRTFNYKFSNIDEFKEYVRGKIQQAVDTYQTVQANIGNTYTVNGFEFTLQSVSFDSGFVYITIDNGKVIVIQTPTTIQEVAQQIYKQGR